MGSGVVEIKHLRQAGVPVPFPRHWQGAQQIVERAIEAFAMAITSWRVRCGVRFYNAVQAAELVN